MAPLLNDQAQKNLHAHSQCLLALELARLNNECAAQHVIAANQAWIKFLQQLGD